jgi:hypothetical protein
MLFTRLPVLVTVHPPARNWAAAVSASPVWLVLLSTIRETVAAGFADEDALLCAVAAVVMGAEVAGAVVDGAEDATAGVDSDVADTGDSARIAA